MHLKTSAIVLLAYIVMRPVVLLSELPTRAGMPLAMGLVLVSLFVVIINRLFWRPLYYYAERKYRLT